MFWTYLAESWLLLVNNEKLLRKFQLIACTKMFIAWQLLSSIWSDASCVSVKQGGTRGETTVPWQWLMVTHCTCVHIYSCITWVHKQRGPITELFSRTRAYMRAIPFSSGSLLLQTPESWWYIVGYCHGTVVLSPLTWLQVRSKIIGWN